MYSLGIFGVMPVSISDKKMLSALIRYLSSSFISTSNLPIKASIIFFIFDCDILFVSSKVNFVFFLYKPRPSLNCLNSKIDPSPIAPPPWPAA